MNTTLIKFAAEAVAAVVLLGIGWHYGRTTLQADWDAEKLVHAQQLADAYAENAGRLQAQTAKFNNITAGMRAAKKEKKNEEDTAIARLDSERVRVTLTPARDPVPGAAAGAGGNNGACETGLPRADAEFLIRLAREADEAVIQLQACQYLLATERQQ